MFFLFRTLCHRSQININKQYYSLIALKKANMIKYLLSRQYSIYMHQDFSFQYQCAKGQSPNKQKQIG